MSDDGPGIPEEKLNSIFETFYTTKEHGSGLGLSIARTIVEIYGGKIWAENEAGGGAAFRFTLPLAEPQAASRPVPPHHSRALSATAATNRKNDLRRARRKARIFTELSARTG